MLAFSIQYRSRSGWARCGSSGMFLFWVWWTDCYWSNLATFAMCQVMAELAGCEEFWRLRHAEKYGFSFSWSNEEREVRNRTYCI